MKDKKIEEHTCKFTKEINEIYQMNLEVINLGGGFGIEYYKDDYMYFNGAIGYYFDANLRSADNIYSYGNYYTWPAAVADTTNYLYQFN